MRSYPAMILVVAADESYESRAIGDYASWHGSIRADTFSYSVKDPRAILGPSQAGHQPGPACRRAPVPSVAVGLAALARCQIWRRDVPAIPGRSPRQGRRAIGWSKFSYLFLRGRFHHHIVRR